MNQETFSKVVKDIEDWDVRVVVLYHGGEPLLNRDVFAYAQTIRQVHPNAKIKMVSNGVLLSKEVSQMLLKSEIDEIEFSLDGEDARENESIRRGSQSQKTLDNIAWLLAERKKTRLTKKLRVKVSSTKFFSSTQTGDSPGQTAVEVATWIKEALSDCNEFNGYWAMKWPNMRIEEGLVVRTYGNDSGNEYSSKCDHVVNTITVRANGDVVPCCYDLMSDLTMGNVNEKSLREIWESKRYGRLRHSIESGNPLGICQECNIIRRDKKYLERQDPGKRKHAGGENV